MVTTASSSQPVAFLQLGKEACEQLKICIWENLNAFRKESYLCDIRLNTDDGYTFPVHSCIVAAASPFFKDTVARYLEENAMLSNVEVDIPGATSTGLNILLEVIYHNEPHSVSRDDANDFLAAAHSLGVNLHKPYRISTSVESSEQVSDTLSINPNSENVLNSETLETEMDTNEMPPNQVAPVETSNELPSDVVKIEVPSTDDQSGYKQIEVPSDEVPENHVSYEVYSESFEVQEEIISETKPKENLHYLSKQDARTIKPQSTKEVLDIIVKAEDTKPAGLDYNLDAEWSYVMKHSDQTYDNTASNFGFCGTDLMEIVKAGDCQVLVRSDMVEEEGEGEVTAGNITDAEIITDLPTVHETVLVASSSSGDLFDTRCQRSGKRSGVQPRLPAEGVFRCILCNSMYQSRKLLNHHMRRVHRNWHRPYCCTICGYKFKEDAALQKHLRRHKECQYYCKKCGRFFKASEKFEKHVKNYHEENIAFTCSVCNKKFRTSDPLRKHMVRDHPEAILQCPQCDHQCLSFLHLLKHQDDNHMKQQCVSCSQTFPKMQMLKNHLSETHGLQDTFQQESFQCELCDFWTLNGHYMQQHMDRIHEKARPHHCDYLNCTYKTFTAAYLKKHQLVHHKSEAKSELEVKNFLCSLCGQMYLTQSGVFYHEKQVHGLHSKGSKPEKKMEQAASVEHFVHVPTCPYCETNFELLTELSSHMTEHHQSMERFKCSKCDFLTATYDYVEAHFEMCHPEDSRPSADDCKQEELPSRDLTQTCVICSSRFSSVEVLARHQSSVHDIHQPQMGAESEESSSNIQCSLCNKTFATRASLKNHLILQHGQEKRFACTLCSFASYYQNFVRRHFAQMHPKEEMPLKSDFYNANKIRQDDMETFTCIICKQFCGDLSMLQLHVKNEHTVNANIKLEHEELFDNGQNPEVTLQDTAALEETDDYLNIQEDISEDSNNSICDTETTNYTQRPSKKQKIR